jgi:hypothetical protein
VRPLLITLALVPGIVAAQDAPKAAAPKDPDLRAELLRRVKTDQDARMALIEFMKRHGSDPAKLSADRKAEHTKLSEAVAAADKENTARLGKVIDQSGWPTVTQVGKDGAHAAWLLVQHADANPKFQRTCLDLMTKLPKEEVSQTDVAYLTDRVLLAEGKKQLYGTQFTSAGGKWEPRPLEEPEKVDERRKAVGLSPLAEYVKQLEALYGKAEKK